MASLGHNEFSTQCGCPCYLHPWWRHCMETISALLVVVRFSDVQFDVSFRISLQNVLIKQSSCRWFQKVMWCLCFAMEVICIHYLFLYFEICHNDILCYTKSSSSYDTRKLHWGTFFSAILKYQSVSKHVHSRKYWHNLRRLSSEPVKRIYLKFCLTTEIILINRGKYRVLTIHHWNEWQGKKKFIQVYVLIFSNNSLFST